MAAPTAVGIENDDILDLSVGGASQATGQIVNCFVWTLRIDVRAEV